MTQWPAPHLAPPGRGLERLSTRDPEAAVIVKFRFFAGMTMPEAAAAAVLPERTAGRMWAYARAFPRKEIGGAGE